MIEGENGIPKYGRFYGGQYREEAADVEVG
jgi:hypothetical protein